MAASVAPQMTPGGECCGDERPKAPVHLGPLTHNNVHIMRKINDICLPIRYSEQFYTVVRDNQALARIAYVRGVPVGVVACKLLSAAAEEAELKAPLPESSAAPRRSYTFSAPKAWKITSSGASASAGGKKAVKDSPDVDLCILSLAVLPAFRNDGVGTALIDWVVSAAKELRAGTFEALYGPMPVGPRSADGVIAHVWTENAVACRFYEKHGFSITKRYPTYYGDTISPPSCLLMRKEL